MWNAQRFLCKLKINRTHRQMVSKKTAMGIPLLAFSRNAKLRLSKDPQQRIERSLLVVDINDLVNL